MSGNLRALFCSNVPLRPDLGAAKVYIELADELRAMGWDCEMIGPETICPECNNWPAHRRSAIYSWRLREYLSKHAADFDVVDYRHEILPYPRAQFTSRTLFVARSVLLVHHLLTVQLPSFPGLRSYIGRFLKGPIRKLRLAKLVNVASRTLREADLINVSNHHDKEELIRRGFGSDKIVVIPYGLSERRRQLFDGMSGNPPVEPTVTFVGTLDPRKGAVEFPKIVRAVSASVERSKFRLLGAHYRDEADIRASFPVEVQDRLEIVPRFDPEHLPSLLSGCSVGIFPSYIEGFPFGVLEMLAASVPVVAYDTPGAPMMLPKELLVRAGDFDALSRKVVELLSNGASLAEFRIWAKRRAAEFSWRSAAEITARTYSKLSRSRR